MSKQTVQIILFSCQESDVIHSIKKPGSFCQRSPSVRVLLVSDTVYCVHDAVSASNLTPCTKAFLRVFHICVVNVVIKNSIWRGNIKSESLEVTG